MFTTCPQGWPEAELEWLPPSDPGGAQAKDSSVDSRKLLKIVYKVHPQRKKNQDIAISKPKINKYKVRSLGVLMFLDV